MFTQSVKVSKFQDPGISRTPGTRRTTGPRGNLRPSWPLWSPGPLNVVSSLQLEFHFKCLHVKLKVDRFWLKFHVLRRCGGKVVTAPGTPGTLRIIELSWMEWTLGCLKIFIKEIREHQNLWCVGQIFMSILLRPASHARSSINFWVVFWNKGIFCEK